MLIQRDDGSHRAQAAQPGSSRKFHQKSLRLIAHRMADGDDGASLFPCCSQQEPIPDFACRVFNTALQTRSDRPDFSRLDHKRQSMAFSQGPHELCVCSGIFSQSVIEVGYCEELRPVEICMI
jgi:hypothetical protein